MCICSSYETSFSCFSPYLIKPNNCAKVFTGFAAWGKLPPPLENLRNALLLLSKAAVTGQVVELVDRAPEKS
jgi:hypothetical protein